MDKGKLARHTWVVSLITTSIILCGSLCACAEEVVGVESSQRREETIAITDMLDRRVEVPAQVNRIAGVWIGALRTLVYLESAAKVIGINYNDKRLKDFLPYVTAHPDLLELPLIETSSTVNEEELIRLGPDVIVASYYTHEKADRLQKRTRIPVVVVKPGEGESEPLDYTDDANDFYRSLRIVGKILARSDRADSIIGYIKDLVSDLDRRTKDIAAADKPTVYVGGLSRKGSHGITMTQRKYPPFTLTRSRNVAGHINAPSNTVALDAEQVIAWDPDILFLDEVNLCGVLQDLKNPKFSSLRAVENGQLYGVLPYPRYGLNHGIVLADSYYVGKVLYPEHFADVDCKEQADKIFSFLLGRPVYGALKEQMGGFMQLEIKQ